MRLRQRIVLTLAGIVLLLGIPAGYAVQRLFRVTAIARELRVRDAAASELVGRLRTTIEEVVAAEDKHVALFIRFRADADQWKRLADDATVRADSQVHQLQSHDAPSPQYLAAITDMARQWDGLKRAIRQEQRSLPFADNDAQDTFRVHFTNPAISATTRSLKGVQAALDTEARQKVGVATRTAEQARNSTLIALALALGLTIVVGTLMTRALLRPIEELRRGMSHVAEGDFEPDVHVPVERPDEIGDLARSFQTMTVQLAELDRLKAEIVSVASHEIKTPLSVIRGYVSLLADGIYGDVSDTQKKTLEAVSDQVDRLTRLVHRLLDISRFEAGGGRLELRRINVRDFLAELTEGFEVLAFQNGIDFGVTVADDTPVNIEGDADRLNEVLGNILSNAFKFTPRGGRIAVDVRRDGAGMRVEVSDSGVGIPPEKLPRIFEKFYQVENSAQPRHVGSGLGLAIAREIVEAHGGTIGADSEENKGTRFTVVLPERPPAPRAADSHAPHPRK